MAKDIKVKIKVDDDGTLKKVKSQSDKAAKSTKNLDKSTQTLNNSRSRYHKQEKGVAQATSNSTKAFSKQAQTIGGGSSGLVGAYATLAAHVFAITAAFGVLSRNKGFQQLEQGIIFTGRAAGQNLPQLSKSLREITDNAISTADAMKAVAIGTSAGFSSVQLEGLTSVAKGASLALGRDMTDALDRLVRGAAKLEPEILDELGIMVRLDETSEKFAGTIGKSASELTAFEKRMAFTNEIIEQGQRKFGALNDVIEANPYSKLAAQFDSLLKGGLGMLGKVLDPIVSVLASNLGILTGALGLFAAGIVKKMVPALAEGGKAAAQFAEDQAELAKNQTMSIKTFSKAPKTFTNLQKSMAEGTATTEDLDKAQTSLQRSLAKHKKTLPGMIKKHGEESEVIKRKRKTMREVETTLKSVTNAQNMNTLATRSAQRANVLMDVGNVSLRETFRQLAAQIRQEHTELTISTLKKSLAAKAGARLSLVFSQLAFSARVLGAALLNAIPIIGQIIFFASMAFEGLKKLFGTKPDVLDKQMKKLKETFDDFPNVINQLAEAYSRATNDAERFEASLKAQVGVIKTGTSELRKFLIQQEAQIIQSQAAAEAELIRARIANPNEGDKSLHIMSGGVVPIMYQGDTRTGKAKQGVAEAAAATIDIEKTQQSLIEGTAMLIATQKQMNKIFGSKGATEELAVGVSALEELNTIMESITKIQSKEEVEAVNKALAALDIRLSGIKDSFDAAQEESRKINEIFTKSEKPTGIFAEEIEALDSAIKAMGDNDKFLQVFERYAEAFEKFGATDAEGARRILQTIKDINKETKDLKLQTALQKEDPDTFRSPLQQEKTNLANLKTKLSTQEKTVQVESGKNEAARKRLESIGIPVAEGAVLTEGLRDAQIARAETSAAVAASEKKVGAMEVENFQDRDVSGITGAGVSVGHSLGAGAVGTAMDKSSNAPMSEKLAAMNDAVNPMLENLAKMSPEGEAMAGAIGGFMALGETMATVFDGSVTGTEDMLAAVGAMIGQVNQIQQASTKKKVLAIDKEIAAEKQRDGQSKESLAKIKQLEKKKESMERKAFERNKKMMMAQVAISTAVSVMGIWSGVKDPYVGPGLATAASALVIGLGAAQLAAIASTSYDGGGSISDAGGGKADVSVGERNNTVDLAKSRSAVGELGYARGAMGTGKADNFKPAFTGARYRAVGGSTGFIVGEQGPELFMPDMPGTIVSADDTASAAGAGTTNLNFTINAIDSQDVERTLSGQTGNIIRMIRETANDAGETFLEGLDERY